ncbi:hypothetical protein FGG08_004860 [Glutinoglossum americanum]|uniref:Uncharacterized protein n=1 Tax=Glutinoglossum americanum TaxID=1670608 RepID=A0A9P8I4G0_9PEZI|nr:hypothetical protein FGG08_004860 [Glutinoglossum americanum]
MENPETLIASAKYTIGQLNAASPAVHYQYEQHARAATNYVDRSQLMYNPARLDEQVWVVESLQRFAQGSGGRLKDVALWCEMQWNRVLQYHAENLNALQGLGNSWLSRAQAPLARIRAAEASHSGSSSSDDEAEAERLRHTQDYVEARTLLLPATEFLRRAVSAARMTGRLTGGLLVTSAEASIELGNVSYRSQSLPHFEDAVRSLREAEAIPSFRLSDRLSG